MKKERIRWMLAVGLLGLLGFSSCSPKVRMRDIRVAPERDTTQNLMPIDSMRPDPGNFPPAKLMYGVPPVRLELKEVREKVEIQ